MNCFYQTILSQTLSASKTLLLFICLGNLSFSCSRKPSPARELEVVTYAQFAQFVSETGYLTDAEKFGWSIVQQDVFGFETVAGANWKKPDGANRPQSPDLPVTQVSYNDAMAYCRWSGTKLPSYEQYWQLIAKDKRKIITNNQGAITESHEANILGNVWEITRTERGAEIRLAGGSIFCSPHTCHGTSKERTLFVDKETGNLHIGFAVLKE